MPAKNALVFLREEDNLAETVVVPGGLAVVGEAEGGLAHGTRDSVLVEFDGQHQVVTDNIAVDIDKLEVYVHLIFREAKHIGLLGIGYLDLCFDVDVAKLVSILNFA